MAFAAGCAAWNSTQAPAGVRMAPLTVDPALLGSAGSDSRTSTPVPFSSTGALPDAHIVLSYPVVMQSAPVPIADQPKGAIIASPESVPPASPVSRPSPEKAPHALRGAGSVKSAPAAVAALDAPAPGPTAKAPVPRAQPAGITAAPTLDMTSLKARLRDTGGIGLLTKLALKNQVDDLMKQFKQHHDSNAPGGVAALRQPYNMLVLKVLSLLQDSDPALARTISGSREAIWDVFADPLKFRANS